MNNKISRRIIVFPIISNKKQEYLICKMLINRGVFSGKWELPGSVIVDNENMKEAVFREISFLIFHNS